MKVYLKDALTAIQESIEDINAYEVLDILYMYSVLENKQNSKEIDEDEKIDKKDIKNNTQDLSTEELNNIDEKNISDDIENNDTQKHSDTIDQNINEEPIDNKSLYIETNQENSNQNSSKFAKKGDYFRVPTHKQVKSFNHFAQAIKILKQTIHSTTEFEFDEEKTVEYIANTDIWSVSLKPKQELKYELTIIVEKSVSVDIWEELYKEFILSMQRFNFFKRVNLFYLFEDEDSFSIYKDKDKKYKVSNISTLPNKRNLTILLSDCVSKGWYVKKGYNFLENITKQVPFAIFNLLPKRVWNRTSIGNSWRVDFIEKKDILNNSLISDIENMLPESIEEHIRIPVIPLETIPIRNWSKLFVGEKDSFTSGIIYEAQVYKNDNIAIPDTKELSAKELIDSFTKTASPLAKELAIYFSTIPLSMDIMKIVQKESLKESNYTHLAEVFLSGLLKKSSYKTKDNKIIYEYKDGVKEIFFDKLALYKKIEILSNNSNFISNNLGSMIDFQALLENPNLDDGVEITDNDAIFAQIIADVFDQIGGEHSNLAKELNKLSTEHIFDKKYKNLLIEELQSREICEIVGETVYIGGTPQDGDYIEGTISMCGEMLKNIEFLYIELKEDLKYQIQIKFDLTSYVEIQDDSNYPLTKEVELELNIECILDVTYEDNSVMITKIDNITIDTVDWSQLYDHQEESIDQDQKAIIPHSKRFQMGSEDGDNDEKPVHEVVFNYDFEIAQYPVTFEEYDLFCEDTDKDKPDDEGWGRGNRPVINVSWHDAKEYCKWLSEKTGEEYRLPTEAEWEYACRAGTTTKWSFGDDENKLKDYAWYIENNSVKTHPVGEKEPNQWGLYDMHGNVWEWCEDDWVDSYDKTPRDGKAYEDEKSDRKVLRGGSWNNIANVTRSADRNWSSPANRNNNVGFRLLRTLPGHFLGLGFLPFSF